MPLLNVVFTVKTTLAGGAPYSGALFVGANPDYTNANNLVLTSDASTGINIAKQFIAQVSTSAIGKRLYKSSASLVAACACNTALLNHLDGKR